MIWPFKKKKIWLADYVFEFREQMMDKFRLTIESGFHWSETGYFYRVDVNNLKSPRFFFEKSKIKSVQIINAREEQLDER